MTDNPNKDKDPQDSAPVDDSEAATTEAATEANAAAEESAEAKAEDKADDATENLTEEEKLTQQVAELTEDLQRVTAEFSNYRKRVQRELQLANENGKAHVVNQLITIADDIERAAEHGDLKEGSPLKAFGDKFMNTLHNLEVAPFGAEGDPFDANIHEAVQDEGGDGEKVLSAVIRKGYKVGDRLLRTAMVLVKGDGGDDADKAADDDAEADNDAEAESED